MALRAEGPFREVGVGVASKRLELETVRVVRVDRGLGPSAILRCVRVAVKWQSGTLRHAPVRCNRRKPDIASPASHGILHLFEANGLRS